MEVISDFVATEQRADSMPEADQYQNEVDFNGFSDPFASAGAVAASLVVSAQSLVDSHAPLNTSVTDFDAEDSDDQRFEHESDEGESEADHPQVESEGEDLEGASAHLVVDEKDMDIEEWFLQETRNRGDGEARIGKKKIEKLLRNGGTKKKDSDDRSKLHSESQRLIRDSVHDFGKMETKSLAPLHQSTALASVFDKIRQRNSKIGISSTAAQFQFVNLSTPLPTAKPASDSDVSPFSTTSASSTDSPATLSAAGDDEFDLEIEDDPENDSTLVTLAFQPAEPATSPVSAADAPVPIAEPKRVPRPVVNSTATMLNKPPPGVVARKQLMQSLLRSVVPMQASTSTESAAIAAKPQVVESVPLTIKSIRDSIDQDEAVLQEQRMALASAIHQDESESETENALLSDEDEEPESIGHAMLENEAEEHEDDQDLDEELEQFVGSQSDHNSGDDVAEQDDEDEDDDDDDDDDDEQDSDLEGEGLSDDDEGAASRMPIEGIDANIAAFFEAGPRAQIRAPLVDLDYEVVDEDEGDALAADVVADPNTLTSVDSEPAPADGKAEMKTLMQQMQEHADSMRRSVPSDSVSRRKAAERRFLETEAGEEDENGELRRTFDDDDDAALDALDPTVVDETDNAEDGSGASRVARLHAKLMAEEDDRRVEIAHDRFVMNDIARAAARQLVGGAMNSDANARAMLAVADLSGNDNVVVKKRRSGGANSGSANLYGYSADDAWDVDHADDDNGRYVSASNLADEVEDDLDLEPWQRELRAKARTQKRATMMESEVDVAAESGSGDALPFDLRRKNSALSLYGLEDETQNHELAEMLNERKRRLQFKYSAETDKQNLDEVGGSDAEDDVAGKRPKSLKTLIVKSVLKRSSSAASIRVGDASIPKPSTSLPIASVNSNGANESSYERPALPIISTVDFSVFNQTISKPAAVTVNNCVRRSGSFMNRFVGSGDAAADRGTANANSRDAGSSVPILNLKTQLSRPAAPNKRFVFGQSKESSSDAAEKENNNDASESQNSRKKQKLNKSKSDPAILRENSNSVFSLLGFGNSSSGF